MGGGGQEEVGAVGAGDSLWVSWQDLDAFFISCKFY